MHSSMVLEDFPTQRYNRCHLCSGRVTERLVVVDYRWETALVAIIQHVPAGVCELCGERYFKAAVVKALERTAHSRARTRITIAVPVRELMAA
jgi:YgiT-type zinc finger domain-containing protein